MIGNDDTPCVGSFIDCTSLSFSYDVMGLVTVSYTMVHPAANFCYTTLIVAGGKTFDGYVTSMNMNRIQGTSWYETHVQLMATTN
jgi:hypothetical protein